MTKRSRCSLLSHAIIKWDIKWPLCIELCAWTAQLDFITSVSQFTFGEHVLMCVRVLFIN